MRTGQDSTERLKLDMPAGLERVYSRPSTTYRQAETVFFFSHGKFAESFGNSVKIGTHDRFGTAMERKAVSIPASCWQS